MNNRVLWSKQTKQWEHDCIKTRRNLWLRSVRLSQFTISPGDRILDLGCGDGLDIQILHKKGYKKIIGVDISQKLLALARKRNPGVRFLRASAEKMPFKNGIFDAVLADSVLYHLTESNGAIREIHRVLTPGGRLCFIEAHQSLARKLFDGITVSPVSRFVPYLRKRKEAYLAEREAITRWRTSEREFFQMLVREGFRKIYCRTDLLSIVCEYQTPGAC